MPHWCYELDGDEHGPLPAKKLKAMLASGQLSLDTPVWQEGDEAGRKVAVEVTELHSSDKPPPLPEARQPATGEPTALSANEVDAIRHPHEVIVLAGSWIVLISLLLVTGVLTLGIVVLFAGIIYFTLLVKEARLQAGNPRVTRETFPDLHQIVERCRRRLGVPESVHVYVKQDPTLNAFAAGVHRHFVIVHSAILEQMDEGEIAAIVGHEFGHVRCRHTIHMVIMMTTWEKSPVMAFLLLPMQIVNFVMMWWSRLAEYSCDRLGAVAAGSAEAMITALLKLSMGAEMHDKLDADGRSAFLKQTGEGEKSVGGVLAALSMTHPHLGSRIRRIKEFARTDLFKRLTGVAS